MRVISVNLPTLDLKTIEILIGDNGMYPSRSELIRAAIRAFLIKELNILENFPKMIIPDKIPNNAFVTLPEGKTYRIVEK